MSAAPGAAAEPIFVLGAHRSGTTLLQRLLNSYDDVVVWGEHDGVLRDVAAAYFRGIESAHLFRDVREAKTSDPRHDWQAWMTGVTRGEWDAAFRRLVSSLFPPPPARGLAHWGFKEIRYGTLPGDRTVELLARLYPEARFAFIFRDPLNAIASGVRRPEGPRSLPDVARVCERWIRRWRTLRDWHTSGRVRSYWIVYEQLIAGDGEIHRLLADLGHALGPRQHEVLAAEGGRGSSFRDAGFQERWRRLPPTWVATICAALRPLEAELGYRLPPLAPGWRLAGDVLWRWGRRRAAARDAVAAQRA